MRSRPTIWVFLCLLGVTGIWLFCRTENHRHPFAHRQKLSSAGLTSVRSTSTAPYLAKTALARNAAQIATAKTNRFAYRLSNTDKTLAQLVHDRHAILLENALIDSSRPVNLKFPQPLQLHGDPGAYIVQAAGLDTTAFRSLLTTAGAKIISYIPNNAYLVEAPANIANALAGNPAMQSVLPYEPYYKVQSTLLAAATSQTILPHNAILTLGLFPDDASQTIAQIQSLGAQIVGQDSSPFGPIVRVMPPQNWTALADLPGVGIIEPYYARVHANDLSRVITGVSIDTLVPTNYMGLTGKNVIVDVNDSGIDDTHPDFSATGTAASGPSGGTRVTGEFPDDVTDPDGHGTFVAGEIAGNGSESHPSGGVNVGANAEGSVSNADFRGKAPDALLFSVNFGNSDSNLQAEAALTNALISNNSWVYGGDQTYDLAAASYDAATRDALPFEPISQPNQQVLFVFSAGNDGYGQIAGANNTADTIDSPGTAKNVITVGATEEPRNITNEVAEDGSTNEVWASLTANDYQVADFSSCGNVGIGIEGTYGRFKPDVVAPGTFTVSTRSQDWDTAAYYNPTNYDDNLITNQVVDVTNLNYYALSIPQNAISVEIQALPFNPLDALQIYVSDSNIPVPGQQSTYDFFEPNEVQIPPDSPSGVSSANYLSEIQATLLNYAIYNTNAQSVAYDLFTEIATTNDDGNYYEVLSNMNNSLGKYYRYETGTSMAAADVSGVLALMQDYFTNQLHMIPSPALLKAMLLNGARLSDAELYNLQVNNTINYEGWGLINLPNSLPPTIATNGYTGTTPSSIFFQDQSTNNALATGDVHTYTLVAKTNNEPLRFTLTWTDPPGNPVAAIKLVNSLQLTVTNTDNPTNIVVYYGNDIGLASAFNTPENPTNNVSLDTINNVQTIIIPEPLGTNYTVTVKGYRVNVNAVALQTNNIVQDYAFVISSGDGDATGSFTVTDDGITSHPTSDQDISPIDTTNAPLDNQILGASSPLLGTNQISVGTNSGWAPTGLVTIGQTNQWHFYIVTNEAFDASTPPSTTDVTNAAFVTFDANTLSIPRMGVFANNDANSTRTEADIDLWVSTDPGLTNLSPITLSNCVNGTQIGASVAGVFHGASLGRGGEEVIVDTNSQHGEVYYVGVQSEDQMASEYSFIPIFTSVPFSQMNNSNGVETVNGAPVPSNIPSGSPAAPGYNDILGISLQPVQIQAVIVTNIFTQAVVGDLVSSLTLDSGVGGRTTAVLMNHDSPNVPGTFDFVYDDSGTVTTVPSPYTLHHSDGPGSLLDFVGQNVGIATLWNFHIANSVAPFSGSVDDLSLTLMPHQNPLKGITVSIPPGSWYYNYVTVPPGFTNLSIFATNLPPTVPIPPGLQMYLNYGTEPTTNSYLFEAGLTNGTPPGNSISYGPPLAPGTYWIGITNGSSQTASVYLLATLSGFLTGIPPTVTASNGPVLTPVAVTSTNIFITNTNQIASVNVGIVATYPRISDLTFTLVSPSGQEILLMENRGGPNTQNAGAEQIFTNTFNASATGGAAASTNYLAANPLGGTLPIAYNFYTVPDQMTVYDTTNPADFNPNGPYCILNTGFINNPPAGAGSQNTLTEYTNTAAYPPGSPGLTIIMNQFGNPYASGNGDAWTYSAGSSQTNFEYLMFTEDTNLTDTPIKFAVPPFGFDGGYTNYSFSFEQATNGDYTGLTNIFDQFGGWTVPTNLTTYTTTFNTMSNQTETLTNIMLLTNNFVSVVTDPNNSLGDNFDSNYLALADGTITRTLTTIPGEQYNLTFWYRGPGIAGWWRGEGNALDSADPENDGQNGSLIGRFDFPAGEVGQSFEMEYNGQPFDFAGTNSYVQIHPQYSITTTSSNTIVESSALDVGAGGEFTIEGWINPTNVAFQQPLVEWLAGVPTNYPDITDTNFNIVAGPFLDRATSHYYYLLGATNWTTSEAWAEMLGGHLATVDTADEENWIYDAFENYDGTNRNLWIGLTNSGTSFAYSSGLTNVIYTDWATNQPNFTCYPNQNYVAIITATNAQSGLWQMADNGGDTCTRPTNIIYGVAEVNAIQTNGVQFWISVTNVPGTTNTIVSSNGCLYANLVDTTNGSHIIFSAPGLVQSNIFQHVALTYSTNSGIANLFYDGTNVASTNLGVFIPKTTGDVLLGKDMSLLTNNFYGGLMDEMSIYSRPLSDAEIWSIYNVSASTTNRLVGKFDPSVTPAYGLAEALVNFGGNTNIIYGVNQQWEQYSYTFIATSNSFPLTITGLEPGMLLDQFGVSQAPLTNFYYFPEQSLDELAGDSAYGDWSLQIWDNRIDAAVPPAGVLDSWVLQLVLQTNAPGPLDLSPNAPMTVTVPPGEIVPLLITVPNWATQATNLVDSDTGPLSVLYNASQPPTGSTADTLLAQNVYVPTPPPVQVGPTLTAGTFPSTPPLPTFPTNYYYLGLSNGTPHAVNATVEVDFNIIPLTNSVPYTGTISSNQTENYFSFVVSNGFEATFQLLKLSGSADLVVRHTSPLPTLFSSDYGSFNETNADQNIYVLTNSLPVPLTNGTWYIGVITPNTGPITYTLLAKELATNASPAMLVIPLTNGVPFTFSNEIPGAALTNFFSFIVTNTVITNVTHYVSGLRFELYDMSGNGDLTVQSNVPPFAPPFFQYSAQPGTIPEYIQVQTNNILTNLATTWYLGVPNNETNPINFTIIAEIETNGVFPAFPGAQGAGAGTAGAMAGSGFTNNTVYHVFNLNDSGYGSLRDAVSSTNRTIVFDISGVIYLQSPLIITNSYLTIAGQTAPGGGITVAGQMTELSTNHDVIIRDIRFRSGGAPLTGFQQTTAGDYTNGQAVGTWTVTSNQVSVVSDVFNAMNGSSFLALADGTISTSLSTIPGQTYALTFGYRGPGIIDWWRGETNSTATTAIDSIGTNNGTFGGGATYTNGEVGRGFLFNGSSSYISLAASPSLDFTNSFTLEMWFETFNPSVPPSYGLLSDRPAPGGVPVNYAINIVNNNGDDGIGTCYYDPTAPGYPGNGSDDGGNLEVARYHMDPTANVFHHLAVELQQIAPFEIQIKTYYEGQLVYTKQMPGNFTNTFNTYPLSIGCTSPGGGEFLNGIMDEVSIYNRSLSDSEVNAIYQSSTNGKFDPVEYSISPPTSLAKAQIMVNGATNLIFYGKDTNWQSQTITFIATSNRTAIAISGMEPGMLLGSLSVTPGNSLQFNTVSNVIADHVSAEWSTNANLTVLNSTNVTVQWSIISDSINNLATNGYGSLLRYGSGMLSFHHNLFADNAYASPQFGDNLNLDFEDNVIYDWGTNSGFSANDSATHPGGYTNVLNYICNYLIASTNSVTNSIAFWASTTNTWIYQTNNFIQNTNSYNTNGLLNGENLGWNMFTTNATEFDREFPFPPVPVDEAYLAYEKVLDFAGPDMAQRDAVDTNIVGNVRSENGSILNTTQIVPSPVSTLPYLDTDQDGIPDFWNETFGGNSFLPHPNAVIDGSGYTELEEYLNWLAGPHALTVTNQPVGVDLVQLFGQTGNLSFFVTNAVNGTVYLTNVLNYTNVSGIIFDETNTSTYSNSFAIFTPTNNFNGTSTNYGMASFDVYVTNNTTVAYFGPVTVSVVASEFPIIINSNIPPTIIVLPPGGFGDPNYANTNYGGSDNYELAIATNAIGVVFAVTNANGPTYLIAKYGQPATLSDYDYISTNTNNESIYIGTNSLPVPLTSGNEYVAVVNISQPTIPITYTLSYTEYSNDVAPIFSFPTNGDVFTNIETTPFLTNCIATDPNSPPLPLNFALVSGPTNMTVTSAGAISWTPTEAQGGTTNLILVSVSNGAYSVTNNFSIIVEVSNLPPVFTYTNFPNQVVIVPGGMLDVTDAAVNPNIPDYPLTYALLTPFGVGASIDTNGVISWSPTLAQAGSNYLFTVVVTDTNPPAINATSLSATNSFYVTVITGATGGSPQTNTVSPGAVNWLAIKVPANAIYATNILVYATNFPVNVWFSTNVPPSITNTGDKLIIPNSTGGINVLGTNTSPAITSGETYFLGVQNTNAVAVGYALEVKFGYPVPPVLTNAVRIASIVHTNIDGTNGYLLTWFAPSNDLFQVQWTASLPPVGWTTFTNIIGYNAAAYTNPTNTQFNFFDNGSQTGGLGNPRFYRLVLLQASTVTLPNQNNFTVQVSSHVTVTNTATDSNPKTILTYNLVNPPAGAEIGTNGVITWTNAMPSGLAALFTTVVADNELPPAMATNQFTVFVAPFPAITNIAATSTNVTLSWLAPTNDQFDIHWTTNLVSPITWYLLPGPVTSTNGVFSFTDTNALMMAKFYELILLP